MTAFSSDFIPLKFNEYKWGSVLSLQLENDLTEYIFLVDADVEFGSEEMNLFNYSSSLQVSDEGSLSASFTT